MERQQSYSLLVIIDDVIRGEQWCSDGDNQGQTEDRKRLTTSDWPQEEARRDHPEGRTTGQPQEKDHEPTTDQKVTNNWTPWVTSNQTVQRSTSILQNFEACLSSKRCKTMLLWHKTWLYSMLGSLTTMNTIELCDNTPLFGIFLETNIKIPWDWPE